ncbi:MAG TPA: transglycosylase domain-containing protein, partial [Kofleriaceae bacterium]
MRIPGLSRRWLIAGAISLGLVLSVTIGLAVVYPRVGAWMIRTKVGGKLATKLGRDVKMGAIEVALGRAVIHGVDVRGPRDGDMPLVHIARVEVAFDGWQSLLGKVVVGPAKLDGVQVTVRRDASGQDNVRDLVDRLRADKAAGEGGEHTSIKPTSITVTHAKLLANDELTGATGLVVDADATWTPDRIVAEARGVTATTLNAPRASAAKIDVEKVAGSPPIVSIEGGELALWPKLALSGIGGKIVANPKRPSEYIIDLAGGYGGVPGRLWTAKGDFDPITVSSSIDLEADKFQLDRLAPILVHSAVVDYDSTSVDTKVHLDVDRNGAKFSGSFHLTGLNVGHPMIADHEVHGLDLSGQVAGSFERATRKLELTQGDFVMRSLPFSITGMVMAPHEPAAAAPAAPAPADPAQVAAAPAVPRSGPHGLQLVKLRLVIPPVECQQVLDAIPVEMAPYMAGYKMHGTFDTDVHLDIDWSDLDATQLDGHIGIKKCKVVDEPSSSPKRLKDEFTHEVEVDKGEWQTFVVGPTNDDFVPLEQISPYLQKSIQSTEDSAFYQHHGFITSEFRTALVNNLKAGKFVQGASSITMQMVKNVLLYREKTLAWKLHELFLT